MPNGLLKKFLTYFYGSGIGLVIGVLTTVISTRILSPEDFGKASMFTLTVSVLMIFIVFGTDQAFVRFFYEEKEELRGKLLFNTLKIPITLLVITIATLFFLKEPLMLYLFDDTNTLVFIVLIIGIVLQVMYRFSLLVIRMQQKAHIFSLLEVINKSLNLILIVILYFIMGSNYEILIYSTVITFFIVTIVSLYIEKKYWFFGKNNNTGVKHSQKDIFHFSYPLVLTTLITWLFQGFDKIAIREWSTFEELGLYAAAFRIVALLMVVQGTFTTFWTPVCYEHYEKYPEDKDFFANTSKIIAFVMFVLAVVTILFKDVIVLLLGPEYKSAAIIMPFLIFMPIMYTLSETTVIGVNFSKKTKWHILVAGVACVANIIGNFILVPIYGAAGAAVSTGLAYVVFFAMRTHISLMYYKVKYGLVKIYGMITLLTFFALQNMIWPNEVITYVTGGLLLVVIVVAYKEQVRKIINLIKSRKGAST